MKPRLPVDVNPGDLCDRKGVPVHPGDLLRTDHYRGKRRRMHYLYHVVTWKTVGSDRALWCVPVREIHKPTGGDGCCYLHSLADGDGVLSASEVVAGTTYPAGGGVLDFSDRKRRRTAAPRGAGA